MLKVSRILVAQILYQGDNITRPFTGKYLFLTADPAHASEFSPDGDIQKFELNIPMSKIWSLRKINDMEQLVKALNEPELIKEISESSTKGELDLKVYDKIKNPEFSSPENLFQSLGFRGVWLNGNGVNSIFLFDEKDATYLGKELAIYKRQ